MSARSERIQLGTADVFGCITLSVLMAIARRVSRMLQHLNTQRIAFTVFVYFLRLSKSAPIITFLSIVTPLRSGRGICVL
jgi:hypothetical protein